MERTEITESLRLHQLYLEGIEGGQQLRLNNTDLKGVHITKSDLRRSDLFGADLFGADLSGSDLSGSDLRCADFSGAVLVRTNFQGSNLVKATLREANLLEAVFRWADLREADLREADLREADLSGADLGGALLSGVDLKGTNLSGAKGLPNAAKYLRNNFEESADGIICYKLFDLVYPANPTWVIEPGSIIEENVNPDPTEDCGCGVNVGTMDWLKRQAPRLPLWRCLIRWIDLADVVVPYNTEGKIRAGRVTLLERV